MQTDFGALSDARVKVWATKTWQEGRDQSFWMVNGFVGKSDEDMNRPVQLVTKLQPSPTGSGTSCVMQLVSDMENDGVVGDNQLEGNEEALVNDLQTIQIDMLRNGVKSKGSMAEQATVIRFRAQGRSKLSFWQADKMDELMHLTASGRAYSLNTDGSTRTSSQLQNLAFASDVVAPSTNRIKYAGAATSEATLAASETVDWDFLVDAHAFAKRQKLRPIREGGKEYYCIVLSTEAARDLRKDSDYKNANKDAGPRSSKNPLFSNALATVDGIVLHEHNKVFNTLGLTGSNRWGSGGTVDGAQNILMGAQAMGFARVGEPFFRESDVTDYGNRPGIGFGRKLGMLKPQFITRASSGTREDFGMISLKTAAAA